MRDMVHVVAQFTVHAEMVDDFIAAASRLLVVPTQSETGCIRYELCQDFAEPTRFVLLESWASAEDLDRHLAQDSLGAVLDELRPYVATPPATRRLKPV